MNINVHIESLTLEGFPITHGQGAIVQAAVETEMVRILTERGLDKVSGGEISSTPGVSIQLTEGSKMVNVGNQIARAIYTSLQPTSRIEARSPFTREKRR